MTDPGYAVWQRNVETGESMGRLTGGTTADQALNYLSHTTGFDAIRLVGYSVERPDGGIETAAEFLVDHAIQAVKVAWMAGAPGARRARHEQLEAWWPALSTALNLLVVSDD